MIDILWQDIRYAVRSLRRAPGFTAAAVLTLALGIGATTAIFSVVETVILKPLAYDEPERLVVIHETDPQNAGALLLPVNALHFRDWRAASRSFDGMAIIGPLRADLSGGGEPVRVAGARVSPRLFAMLGAQPMLGRFFGEEEDAEGRDRVVVLGYDLWRRRFAGDPAIVGQAVRLDGEPYTVVGVLPAGFSLPRLSHLYGLSTNADQPQFWKPFAAGVTDLRITGRHNHTALARLGPGVPADAARAELNTILAETLRGAPGDPRLEVALVPMQDQIVSRSRRALQLILAAVAMVLLIACVNIANMLLARSIQRRREMSIRRAAGATRARLIWQLLSEGLILSTIGGIAGLAVAAVIVRLVLAWAPVDVPRLDEVALDVRMVLFAAAVSWLAGVLVALIPAWQLSRERGEDAALAAARHTTGSRATERARTLLVAAEVGGSTICVVVAGLLLLSFVNLLRVDGGFTAGQVLTSDIMLPDARYGTNEAATAFRDQLLARLRAVPGIAAVGLGDRLPVSGLRSAGGVTTVERRHLPDWPTVDQQAADAGYFETLRIPLRAGRLFDDRDRGRRVAVVSERAAALLWPGEPAVGRRFVDDDDADVPVVEVVGVVADVRTVGLGEIAPPAVYVPYWDNALSGSAIVVRASGDARAVAAAVRDEIRRVDPELAVPPLRTMDDVVAASVSQRRFQMQLVLLLAAAALLLAGLGIYGVVAHWVAQRTSEIGIRMAIGAAPRRVRIMVLRQALTPVIAGVAGGVAAAMALGRLLRAQLFGIDATDLTTYVAAAVFLTAVGLLASYLPARRATRIDPVTALRAE